jgi:hypothetical protein
MKSATAGRRRRLSVETIVCGDDCLSPSSALSGRNSRKGLTTGFIRLRRISPVATTRRPVGAEKGAADGVTDTPAKALAGGWGGGCWIF